MTDDCESREPNECSNNRTGSRAAAFVAVLLAYALSPIPLAFGLQKMDAFERLQKPFYVFYAPVVFLADQFEFVSNFYQWQERLFDL